MLAEKASGGECGGGFSAEIESHGDWGRRERGHWLTVSSLECGFGFTVFLCVLILERFTRYIYYIGPFFLVFWLGWA